MGWTRAQVLNVAKRTGYPVVEAWSSHNKGAMGVVYGPMLHHTGTPATAAGDYPTLRVVRDGRAGLENSLCMYGLGKNGTIYCINNNISWHAGAGNWRGVTNGNAHFAGIEAEGPGTWSAAQLDSYQKLAASILLEAGRGIEWLVAHKEYALPAGRKPDPAGIDLADFRRKVSGHLATGLKAQPAQPKFSVTGAFLGGWDKFGRDRAGQPVSAEATTRDGKGRVQSFERAIALWEWDRTGKVAHFIAVPGAIFEYWRSKGAEDPANPTSLGYPTSPESVWQDGKGVAQGFERGLIVWHPSFGVHAVRGNILQTWFQLQAERGIGYPVKDEVWNGNECRQSFERGDLVWHEDTKVVVFARQF